MFGWRAKKIRAAGQERYRRAALTSIMNLISQVVQVATGLISVPLALGYVGVERFGIWMALLTGLMFITFADFGVGLGAQDRISKLVGVGSLGLARQSFFSAFGFVGVLFLLCPGQRARGAR